MPVYGAGSKRLGRDEKEAEWQGFHALHTPGNSHCAPTVCDGTNGTLNLADRFIRGISASDVARVETLGGEAEHDHNGTTGGLEAFGRMMGIGNGFFMAPSPHSHSISKVSNLPPYMDLVYIIKLAEK
jgi:hypothetical protein